MEYVRHGRSVVPLGSIFDDINSAIEFAQKFENKIETQPINELRFTVDEEGYLRIILNDAPYFITIFALKDLCRLLKLPLSFVNKFPPSGLMLENLNENPYLKTDNQPLKLMIWNWDENQVISGILPQEIQHIPIIDFLNTLKTDNVFERAETKPESIIVDGEEIVLYFTLPDEIAQEGFSFTGGFAIHYLPNQASDTYITPFYNMAITSQSGELFDFDFEADKKLRIAKRKKSDFEELTMEFATQYTGEDLGVDYENTIKRGMAARQLSSLKFALLKTLKSRATSIYSYKGIKVETGAIMEKIIPEYKQFLKANKEELKQREKFEANTMLADFYLPLFYNRIFTFQSSSENPYFFVRYRQAIGKIFDKVLEETGDIILT